MPSPMLEIDDIHVYRGRTYVLQGVGMHVLHGEIVALIGGNGAGKTTTLRTISGLLHPREGDIRFTPEQGGKAVSMARMAAEDIVRLGVSHCPEGRQVFAGLTVRENLLLGAYLRRDMKAVEADMRGICDMFPVLGERSRQLAGSLSGGEQMMLALGRALMSKPRLLILDEPSLGLAPIVVEAIFAMLAEINSQGMTILLVEQNAVMALELAHRAYVIETGQIKLDGPCCELANNEQVRSAYLGGS